MSLPNVTSAQVTSVRAINKRKLVRILYRVKNRRRHGVVANASHAAYWFILSKCHDASHCPSLASLPCKSQHECSPLQARHGLRKRLLQDRQGRPHHRDHWTGTVVLLPQDFCGLDGQVPGSHCAPIHEGARKSESLSCRNTCCLLFVQDGSYLAEFLLDKGYEVHGIVRRSSSFNTGRIQVSR